MKAGELAERHFSVAHEKAVSKIEKEFGNDLQELIVEDNSIKFNVNGLEFLLIIKKPVNGRWDITLVNPDGYRWKKKRKRPTDSKLDDALDLQITIAGLIHFDKKHIQPIRDREKALKDYNGPKLIIDNTKC